MKAFFILLLLATGAPAFAQNYQKEINEHVWQPFIATFSSYDANGFLAVHSKDLIRSPRESKTLSTWDEYLKEMKDGDKRSQQDHLKRSIELRFSERIANDRQAIDVGIYKTTVTNSKGEARSFYGRFHVVLRKEKGVWKILVDTDSSENNTIGEKEFLAASPLQ